MQRRDGTDRRNRGHAVPFVSPQGGGDTTELVSDVITANSGTS